MEHETLMQICIDLMVKYPNLFPVVTHCKLSGDDLRLFLSRCINLDYIVKDAVKQLQIMMVMTDHSKDTNAVNFIRNWAIKYVLIHYTLSGEISNFKWNDFVREENL